MRERCRSFRSPTSEASAANLNAGGSVRVDLDDRHGRLRRAVATTGRRHSISGWSTTGQGPVTPHSPKPADRLDASRHLRRGIWERTALSVVLGPTAFTDFFPDRAFVVRSGDSPVDSFVLTGPSTLFDSSPAPSGPLRRSRHRDARVRSNVHGDASADFAKLVAQGRQLFLHETFEGNGRTCGTCHVESEQLHRRSGTHCEVASQRSALRGRDQSRIGGARESRLAAPVWTDPRQRRRVRPTERVRAAQHAKRAGARATR